MTLRLLSTCHVFRYPACMVLLATACFSATGPVETVTLQGQLAGSDGVLDPPTGSVAIVIGEKQTQMGVGVSGAAASVTLGWAVVEGTCFAPGNRVGPASTYPAIAVSSNGSGAMETVLFRRLDPAVSYATLVHANGDGTGSVLACADMARR